MNPQPHFVVDKEGLAKLLERKGKHFAVYELIQNSWDEASTQVEVLLSPADRGTHRLIVTDDNPEGFKDLSHAYTLFAESEKKADPGKRGRFNLGEKLVLAICDEASIATTKGTVRFNAEGRTEHTHPDSRQDSGTTFSALIRMTKAEAEKVERFITSLIPPAGVKTTFNGRELVAREPARVFQAKLPTEVADEDGRLVERSRETDIALFLPLEGEKPMLYELGIPVQRLDTLWHVDVRQKVPLTMDREAVRASYARAIKAEVLNHAADLVPEDKAGDKWISEALEDKRITAEAADAALTKRFGEKRVIFDPSDLEANKVAAAKGYTVIPGRALSGKAHAAVKQFELAKPAGQVTPSNSTLEVQVGKSDKFLDRSKWTPGIQRTVDYTETVGRVLLGRRVAVQVVNDPMLGALAFYGSGTLTFNVGRLGYQWFDQEPTSEAVTALVIHELAHEAVSDHLSHHFHDETCRLGARLARAAASDPDIVGWFQDAKPTPVTA